MKNQAPIALSRIVKLEDFLAFHIVASWFFRVLTCQSRVLQPKGEWLGTIIAYEEDQCDNNWK